MASPEAYKWVNLPLFRYGAAWSALALLYGWLAWLASGGGAWWQVDVVHNTAIFWGDDSYRYFLVRSAVISLDPYWFNFALPAFLLLDGLLVFLSFESLVLARILKGALLAFAVLLVYRSVRSLGGGRSSAFISSMLLALNPLFIFVGLSFYGEAWLTLLLVFSLYCHTQNRYELARIFISLMPLVRPEGLFFVLAIGLADVIKGRWLFAAISFLPGSIYFLLIVVLGPGVDGYIAWRSELVSVYHRVEGWYGGEWNQLLIVFPVVWVLPSLWGLSLSAVVQRIWPFLMAAIMFVSLFVMLIMVLGVTSFEVRYFSPMLALLAIGFGMSIDRVLKSSYGVRLGSWKYGIVVLLSIVVLAKQLASSIAVERFILHYQITGRWITPEVDAAPFEVGSYVSGVSSTGLDFHRQAAALLTDMVWKNREIRTLVIGVDSIHIFYWLDPAALPADLLVVAAPIRSTHVDVMAGEAYGYFARPPFAGRFVVGVPEDGRPQLLYVERISELVTRRYPYHWVVGPHDIFLLGGDLVGLDR